MRRKEQPPHILFTNRFHFIYNYLRAHPEGASPPPPGWLGQWPAALLAQSPRVCYEANTKHLPRAELHLLCRAWLFPAGVALGHPAEALCTARKSESQWDQLSHMQQPYPEQSALTRGVLEQELSLQSLGLS